MMRTTILLAATALAVVTLATPVQANDLGDYLPEVQGNCLVEDDEPFREYEACVRTDGFCPRVTFRGWFGQGSIPYCGP